MQRAFKLSAFLSLTNIIRPADNGRLCRNFQKKSTSRFYKSKPLFLCNLHKIPKKMRPGGPTHICQLSYCRPPAAAQAGTRRSVPIWKIFLLKVGRRSVRIFSRIAPFTRSGRICSYQSLKAAACFNRQFMVI